MSQRGDLVDERIRSTLRRTPVGEDDAATALPLVRARARARRHRRRAALAVGAVAVLALGASLAALDRPETVVTDAPPTTSAPESPHYGFAPLTPLVDEPLPIVPRTVVTELDDRVLSVESAPGRLTVRLEGPIGFSASSRDPEFSPALSLGGVGASPDDPSPRDYFVGVTRAEVARVEAVAAEGTVSAPTIQHPALPQLSFFLFEDTVRSLVDGRRGPEVPQLIAYGVDGTVLTDYRRIHAESQAFFEDVDRRKGVEEKVAAVQGARLDADGSTLVLTVFSCGAEVQPRWTEERDTVTVSATVKLPSAEGDCLSGETTEVRLGLEEPLADRTVIDGRTVQPLPVQRG